MSVRKLKTMNVPCAVFHGFEERGCGGVTKTFALFAGPGCEKPNIFIARTALCDDMQDIKPGARVSMAELESPLTPRC